MIAIFCADGSLLPAATAGAQRDAALTVARCWSEFEHGLAAAECSVAVVPRLCERESLPALLSIRAGLPLLPMVLVTEFEPGNVRHLHRVQVEEVVWTVEMRSSLWAAVERACAGNPLARVARALRDAEHLAPKLRAALVYACTAAEPVRSTSRLAASVPCDRRTLWYHWRKAVGPGESPRLEDFLDWLLLLRASAGKGRDRSWRAVAEELGVHEQTLSAIAKRLGGDSLGAVASRDAGRLPERFEEAVVSRLTRTGLDKTRGVRSFVA